jgi:predicted SAM-dependent methyltransferase
VAVFVRQRFSKSKIRRLIKERKELLIELGSGNRKGTGGWITLDITKDCDIAWDLRNGLPFPDASVAGIYSSHFFEHLSYKETQVLLDECKRVLAPGGTFSICVPIARLFIEAYFKPESADKNRLLGYKPACNNTTSMDFINYVAYMDGHHKYMFDEQNLLHILEAKGFRNVRLRPFQPGLDLQERDSESIYALAER